METERLTVRIPRELRDRIRQQAADLQMDYSQIVREALDHYLVVPESAHHAFKKRGLIGIVKTGPRDLSTNKKHMAGFGGGK